MTTSVPAGEAGPQAEPSLAADARVWFRIGCLSFGGPAGQIALMQRMLVDELRWIAPERFLTGLDLAFLLPGPEAQQLATYVGWTRQGWRGGVVAGALFVLPGALVMAALSIVYATWGNVPLVAALFAGVRCAVVAIVVEALLRISSRALRSRGALFIAGAAFAALALFGAPFPLVVAAAAAAGWLLHRDGSSAAAPSGGPARRRARAHAPAAVAAALWLAPIGALFLRLGPDALLTRIALRFAELAVLSFGGAYALLSALADRAVGDGWLAAAQMADGLALAETTPGPLILVLQFVAFVAAHGSAAGAPVAAGLAASAVGLWALFLPSFVWIFLAAPHLERVERSPILRRAVRGVSAAVVGVILHLTVWFALHVFFAEVGSRRVGPMEFEWPAVASIDLVALAIAAVSAILLFVARLGIARTLAVAAVLGVAASFV